MSTAYALIKLEKIAFVKLTGKVRKVQASRRCGRGPSIASFDLDAKSQKVVGRKRLTNDRYYGLTEWTESPARVRKELKNEIADLEVARVRIQKELKSQLAQIDRLQTVLKSK